MTWIKIKRTIPTSDEPIISLNNNRFSYNVIFYKIAELAKFNFVTYFVDFGTRKIGFEFTIEENADSFKLIKNEKKEHYSQSVEIFKIPWIQKVSKEKSICRFRPIKEGKKWVITLIPAFDNIVKRSDYLKIGSDLKGIYRYLLNDKIVYIGKGNIRDRLNEPQRKEWNFEIIEYSIIDDVNEQFEWESFWIESYKNENDGYLPSYNLIAGKSIE